MKEVQNEELFQELDNEVAASCSGGVVSLYEHDRFQGPSLSFRNGATDLRNWNFNDKTSSLRIVGNEEWAFYREPAFRGTPVILGRGNYTATRLQQLGLPNDSISSIRRTR